MSYTKYTITDAHAYLHGTDVEIDDRQLKLICCIGNKKNCKETAEIMNLSDETIKTHIRNLKADIGLTNQDRQDRCDQWELVDWALKHYIIDFRDGEYVSTIKSYLSRPKQLKLELEF